jgi:hypothetical protein
MSLLHRTGSFTQATLASGGVYYPKSKDGSKFTTVKMYDLTAYDDNILSDMSYIQNGTMVDVLLKSKIEFPEGLKYEDLLIGDREGLLIYIRGRMQPEYSFRLADTGQLHTVNLTALEIKDVVTEMGSDGLLSFVTPCGTMEFKYKLMTVGDEAKIAQLERANAAVGITQKISKNLQLVQHVVKKLIVNRDGKQEVLTEIGQILKAVENGSIPNLYAFREAYEQSMPGVIFEVAIEDKGGKRFRKPIPFNGSFFIPNARI